MVLLMRFDSVCEFVLSYNKMYFLANHLRRTAHADASPCSASSEAEGEQETHRSVPYPLSQIAEKYSKTKINYLFL